jgi:hypothetical protein
MVQSSRCPLAWVMQSLIINYTPDIMHSRVKAIRGACLHALRTTRAEAHAALDDHEDTAARRRETDDTDTVLGVLPAAPTTFVTKGWMIYTT